MMKEAEALQKTLMQAQSELGNIEVKGIAGGGLIEILMSAQGEFKGIKIKKEAVDPSDVEMLEDLITSAFRDAANKAQVISQEKLKKLTGNKGLPSIF